MIFGANVLGSTNILNSAIPPAEEYTSLKFFGESILDNVKVTSETLTEAEIIATSEQIWDRNTLMLANFENTLEAGNIQNSEKLITHWRIRRRRPTEVLATLLAEIDSTNSSFTDYTPRNLIDYIYSVYAVSNGEEGEGSSETAMTEWYGWILSDYAVLPATPTTSFTFDLENKTGNISPKRGYTIYDNYSQFKAFRFDDRNYSEGSFETMPYELNGNEIDTSLDVLEELIVFLNNKGLKTLRNSKGQSWTVITYDADYQLMDNISYEVNSERRDFPTSVRFKWCEVVAST